MKTVVVIGCGFAGIAAIKLLSRYPQDISLIVIDKNTANSFLPLLPDLVGRDLAENNITYPIDTLSHSYRFRFINSLVTDVDLTAKRVFTASTEIPYDYLLIASGSETNFYGNDAASAGAMKLDTAHDVQKIRQALQQSAYTHLIIAGGGYTGIEMAAGLRRYCSKHRQNPDITIVERADRILGPLPEWMRTYVHNNLRDLRIDVLTKSVITQINDQHIVVNNAKTYTRALLIWAAGVQTAEYIQKLPVPKNPQGRLISDRYLQVEKSCFAAGDAALFLWKNTPLRMSVQFALTQGECAAKNILRAVQARPLITFKPKDPGYIIPLANNRSCGSVLGLSMRGMLPTMLHFLLCLYYLYGIKNKCRLLIELIRSEFKQKDREVKNS